MGTSANEYIAGLAGESALAAAARKSDDNSVPTFTEIPGPAGMKMRFIGNVSAKTILFEGDVPDGTTLQIGALSGNTFVLGNTDNQNLQAYVDYGFWSHQHPRLPGPVGVWPALQRQRGCSG